MNVHHMLGPSYSMPRDFNQHHSNNLPPTPRPPQEQQQKQQQPTEQQSVKNLADQLKSYLPRV